MGLNNAQTQFVRLAIAFIIQHFRFDVHIKASTNIPIFNQFRFEVRNRNLLSYQIDKHATDKCAPMNQISFNACRFLCCEISLIENEIRILMNCDSALMFFSSSAEYHPQIRHFTQQSTQVSAKPRSISCARHIGSIFQSFRIHTKRCRIPGSFAPFVTVKQQHQWLD